MGNERSQLLESLVASLYWAVALGQNSRGWGEQGDKGVYEVGGVRKKQKEMSGREESTV